MRNWLFHPLVFYPLVAAIAAIIVLGSLMPQNWPRQPAPVTGEIHNGMLVLEGAAFNSPQKSPEQQMTVERDFWGHPQSLHIAVLANQPLPTPGETGTRILLTPQAGAALGDNAVTVEVSYRPQPVNTASGLAVSLQGPGPADWVTLPVAPQAGVLKFDLRPGARSGRSTDAIGLRAISTATDQAYGLEIIRILAYPSRAPPTPAPTPTPVPAQTSQPAAGH